MALKGYTKEELIEMIDKMFYHEIATSNKRWECKEVTIQEGVSIPRQGLNIRLDNLKVYHDRRVDYEMKSKQAELSAKKKVLFAQGAVIISNLICQEENGTAENQRKYFEKDRNLFLSRSYIEFPLDKKINSLYDNLSAFYLFYEDVATLGNNRAAVIESYANNERALEEYAKNHIKDKAKAKEFLSLKKTKERVEWAVNYWGPNAVDVFESLDTVEDKIQFLKERIIITHRELGDTENPAINIALSGKFTKEFSSYDNKQAVLPELFVDFNKITLKDTFNIKNNDLAQWIQSKIDFDKENLKVLCQCTIRGDEYRLLEMPIPRDSEVRSRMRGDYLVRYVCPSTQRVYHNSLNESNLRLSPFYKKGDNRAILLAWWNITHCGEDPTIDLPVIRS